MAHSLGRDIYVVGATDMAENVLRFQASPKSLGIHAGDDVPEAVFANIHRLARRIATNGDGACALHSVFGTPDDEKELFFKNARKTMSDYLQQPWSAVEAALPNTLAIAIQSNLWTGFLLPVLRYYDDDVSVRQSLTKEQEIFAQLLDRPGYEFLRQRAKERYAHNCESQRAKDVARTVLLQEAPNVFKVGYVEYVWEPLALQKNLLPALPHSLVTMSVEEILILQKTSDSRTHDFLFPPPEELLIGASDVKESLCKFLCLFNPKPLFNGLRESFLMQLCVDGDLSTVQDSIFEETIYNLWISKLTESQQETLQRFATDHMNEFKEVIVSTGADSTVNTLAWPCFVRAMCCDGYYLSIDELLCFCAVVGQNVIVCREEEIIFSYAGSVCQNVDMPAVWIRLLANASGRGHFERLIFEDDYKILRMEADTRIEQQRLQQEQRAAEQQQKEREAAQRKAAERKKREETSAAKRRLEKTDVEEESKMRRSQPSSIDAKPPEVVTTSEQDKEEMSPEETERLERKRAEWLSMFDVTVKENRQRKHVHDCCLEVAEDHEFNWNPHHQYFQKV